MREAFALLPDYLGQHVVLSVAAIVLGTAISLPLALAAARRPRLQGPLLGFVGIVQTIPALALLALFYPVLLGLSSLTTELLGVKVSPLGFLPALLALTLYSMLPVLRNTVTALAEIDPAVLMAAKGVGMTPGQSLRLVELPLAAPVIVAGIRTATVWVVGTATLSTPIGQTSLGNYIFTGLQTENWVLVLFGCISAAVLAMVLDQLLALMARGFARRTRVRVVLAGVGLALVVAAALFPSGAAPRTSYVIGAKNFTEQFILADVIARRLDLAGFDTTLTSGLGSTVAFRALASNTIDVYVDYTGTLWANQMQRSDMPGREVMLRELKDWLQREHKVELLGTLGFENAYVLAMRADRAASLHIETLADLSAHARGLIIGGDFEIFARPEWRAVSDAYGLAFASQRQFQPEFMYRAVADGDVDVITAFSSDGRIARYNLKILADPKAALPPYDAVVLLGPRHAAALRPVLGPLIGAISLEKMQQANLMADQPGEKKTPAEVGAWLTQVLSSFAPAP